MSDPPVHSDTPQLLGTPDLAHTLAPSAPDPLGAVCPSFTLALSASVLTWMVWLLHPLLRWPGSQSLGFPGSRPPLASPSSPPGCQGPPASRAQLLPALGGGGHKGALVTTKLGPGSLTPGSYQLLPREDEGLPALLLPLPPFIHTLIWELRR